MYANLNQTQEMHLDALRSQYPAVDKDRIKYLRDIVNIKAHDIERCRKEIRHILKVCCVHMHTASPPAMHDVGVLCAVRLVRLHRSRIAPAWC